ncbi:MAG: ATPase, T2SS/T4P/T4SS family [Actinomycetota bacterium]
MTVEPRERLPEADDSPSLNTTPPNAPADDAVAEVCRLAAGESGDVDAVVGRAAAVVAPLATTAQRALLVDAALARLTGFDDLQRFIDDPSIDEVLVNSDGCIRIDRDGQLRAVGTITQPRLLAAIERALAPLGRRVDRSSPIVDARLPGGRRLCAVLPPASLDGPVVAVRRFAEHHRHLTEFTTSDGVDMCRRLLTRRNNIVVSGATSSGKTSLLASLLAQLDRSERLVVVEDTSELPICRDGVVRLETRPPSSSGPPPITMVDLVRTALRLRPDRIVVGEVRGDEVVGLVQAMNTGHDGSCSTCHANSASDALVRLETLVMQAAPSWPLEAIRRQLASSIDAIIHLARDRVGRRRIVEIAEVGHPSTGPRASPTVATTTLARLVDGRLTSVAEPRRSRQSGGST